MAMLGVPVHVTEKLLNHVSGTFGGIVAVYQRYSYQDEMRAAMDKWEAYIAAMMAEEEPWVKGQLPVSAMEIAA